MAPSRRLRLLVPSLFEFPKHLELFPNLLTSLGSDDECATSTSRAQQILSAASITAAEDIPFRQERPRPAQGGERISEGFLMRLGRSECLWRFRFAADELIELAAALRLPPIFRTPASGYAVPRLEAITLTCARLARPGDIYDLVKEYDRSAAAISEIVNHTICLIDVAWAHLLDFDHNHLLAPQRLSEYASAIRNAGAPMSTVWGFIDCTLRRISRPTWFQRAAYSGYKKYHALKYQAVMIPNGMFAHLFGPWEGRRTDPFMLAESGLLEKCAKYAVQVDADDGTPLEHQYFQLYGDPAYGVNPFLVSPYSGPGQRSKAEQEFNTRMSSARIEVEHGFGVVLNTWSFLYTFWKHRVYSSPIGRYYRVAVLLTNARNCFHPNQVALHFNCRPPNLHEYFHM